MTDASPARRRQAAPPARVLAAFLAGGMAAVAVCYAIRPPGLDPITIWPFAFWGLPVAVIALLLLPLLRWRLTLLLAGYALLVTLVVAEEPRFLLRELWRVPEPAIAAARAEGTLLRVVTMNCAGGREEAILDALAQDPDIILLQECPGEVTLQRIAPEGWETAGWLDPAIMVRGRLEAERLPPHLAHFVYYGIAYPEALGGRTPVAVLSTRLLLPLLRFDLWRPTTWREAAKLRGLRTISMKQIADQVRAWREVPIIVGGDFNTPAGDSLFAPLRALGLTDSFLVAGAGWPNTITSDFPVSRIDQLWVSEHLRPLSGRVVVTPHSDHRMVVMDLALR
ncbi:MAG: endonuclease/exonuclease/phosphatase family protein [Armatimonadota bacterium]